MMRLLTAVLCAALAGCSADGQAAAPDQGFTIVMLPDTQHYTMADAKGSTFADGFYAQTEWIAAHARDQHIAFVTHVGDLVEHGDAAPAEWEIADRAMSKLDGVVPWGVVPGNHDYDNGGRTGAAKFYLQHFGPQRFRDRPWYGGASENGLNNFEIFPSSPGDGGRRFLILHLEASVPDSAIRWAESVLAEHPDLPAIVTTHIYTEDLTSMHGLAVEFRRDVGNSGEQIWQKLIRKHSQIFMVLCGHWWPGGGEGHQVSMNDAGQPVFEVLADYQGREHGGDSWLRLIRFDPAENKLRFETYSPALDRYETDWNSQFEYPLDFATRFAQ